MIIEEYEYNDDYCYSYVYTQDVLEWILGYKLEDKEE
jgi:hypothetical protein